MAGHKSFVVFMDIGGEWWWTPSLAVYGAGGVHLSL
jgi:hypothetical protein